MGVRTIDEVVARLDQISAESERDKSRIGYFAALYRQVTAAVRDDIRAGRFADGARMERMDVAFANRYFDALDAWRAGTDLTATWRVAFDACGDHEPTVLQHMYLGLAAHLLLDLGIAAAETAPGPLISDIKFDFDHINVVV